MSETTSPPQPATPTAAEESAEQSGISEISLKDLDPRVAKQVQAANKAIEEGKPDFAINVCSSILSRNPGCLDVRRILRRAQLKVYDSKNKGLTQIFGKLKHKTRSPFASKAAKSVETDPEAAMTAAEEMLSKDPANPVANRMLGQAAAKLGLHNTAVFALETIKRNFPDDVNNLLDLGNAYIEAGRSAEAIKVGDEILEKQPANNAANEMIKVASIRRTIEAGKYDKGGSFRDSLANADEQAERERQTQAVRSEDANLKLIERAKAALESNPDDLNLYKEVSGYYKQMGKFDDAIEWIEKARNLPKGSGDASLERSSVNLQIQKEEAEIAELEEQLEKDPENKELSEKVERLKKELHHFHLEQAKSFVEKYPNDYAYRFDYGQLLYEEGETQEAAKQFQMAVKNPKNRLKALLYLGRCFKETGKYDLAAEELNNAKKESPGMSNLKKDIIYELANCYEAMDRKEDAIEELKLIYRNDMGYRDVAERIDQFYESK